MSHHLRGYRLRSQVPKQYGRVIKRLTWYGFKIRIIKINCRSHPYDYQIDIPSSKLALSKLRNGRVRRMITSRTTYTSLEFAIEESICSINGLFGKFCSN
jgi:hypothetical protein